MRLHAGQYSPITTQYRVASEKGCDWRLSARRGCGTHPRKLASVNSIYFVLFSPQYRRRETRWVLESLPRPTPHTLWACPHTRIRCGLTASLSARHADNLYLWPCEYRSRGSVQLMKMRGATSERLKGVINSTPSLFLDATIITAPLWCTR